MAEISSGCGIGVAVGRGVGVNVAVGEVCVGRGVDVVGGTAIGVRGEAEAGIPQAERSRVKRIVVNQ
jgi:hypothetical protein